MAAKYERKEKKNIHVGHVIRAFFSVVFFFSRVARKYRAYNQKVAIIIGVDEKSSNVGGLRALKRRNQNLVFRMIYLPLFLAFVVAAYVGYSRINEVANFTEEFKKAHFEISLRAGKASFVRLRHAALKLAAASPIHQTDWLLFLASVIAANAGAMFLSRNPVFVQGHRIEKALKTLGIDKVDEHPWRVTWTPVAIMFETYAADGDQFKNETKFWNAINFKPGDHLQVGRDTTALLFNRAYELPAVVDFAYSKKVDIKK